MYSLHCQKQTTLKTNLRYDQKKCLFSTVNWKKIIKKKRKKEMELGQLQNGLESIKLSLK